jgi:hypothetical protein
MIDTFLKVYILIIFIHVRLFLIPASKDNCMPGFVLLHIRPGYQIAQVPGHSTEPNRI